MRHLRDTTRIFTNLASTTFFIAGRHQATAPIEIPTLQTRIAPTWSFSKNTPGRMRPLNEASPALALQMRLSNSFLRTPFFPARTSAVVKTGDFGAGASRGSGERNLDCPFMISALDGIGRAPPGPGGPPAGRGAGLGGAAILACFLSAALLNSGVIGLDMAPLLSHQATASQRSGLYQKSAGDRTEIPRKHCRRAGVEQ